MPAAPISARRHLATERGDVYFHSLPHLVATVGGDLGALPYSVRILLESITRPSARVIEPEPAEVLARWPLTERGAVADLSFCPTRVLLQDFSGVPVVLDLAALRAAAAREGFPVHRVSPVIPAHLVVDHSVQVDVAGTANALGINTRREFQRNAKRYGLLRWAEQAFDRFQVTPPGNGIIHQINLERLAEIVTVRQDPDGMDYATADTVLGTDSHTPMVGGLGVLGWGVGGIEATAVLLGEPVTLAPPRVIGVRLTGRLRPGVTATDLVLTLTQELRQRELAGAFIEFCGDGASSLSVPDRATLANMAPDYGATTSYFPVDEETLRFLAATGRPPAQVDMVERYCKEQGLFKDAESVPSYAEEVVFDLASVQPCAAGPRRPDERVPLGQLPKSFHAAYPARPSGDRVGLVDGAVVIAAVTSCTNTSHPGSMITAGLVAKRAVEFGLSVPSWVKTSLAPGSRAVPLYLNRAGLMAPLEKLGFGVVAFGCTTCHGMSGPLDPAVARALEGDAAVGVAVISGNRNFEGRIHPQARAVYLASPGLVVAYALAGTVTRDLTTEPLGVTPGGRAVYLADLWPSPEEVADAVRASVDPVLLTAAKAGPVDSDSMWRKLPVPGGDLYSWDPDSTYILQPPYLHQAGQGLEGGQISGARVLAKLGDSVSTDHISPVGTIAADGDSGRYLLELGVATRDFNSFGARRGNHHVMVRGTFANSRLRNEMAGGREGAWTVVHPSGQLRSIHEAATAYQEAGVPLVVVAGRNYGCGSARDWAAKGTRLLGVRAVLAESFERIHRSNLVCMGVLPLTFLPGESAASHRIDGSEIIDLLDLDELYPGKLVTVRLRTDDGSARTFVMTAAIKTAREVDYLRCGGILLHVLASLTRGSLHE